MKLILLVIFVNILSSAFGQTSQLKEISELYRKDGITKVTTIVSYYDTTYLPEASSDFFTKENWNSGNPIKLYPVVSVNDTIHSTPEEAVESQFEYSLYYGDEPTISLESNNYLIDIEFSFNSTGQVISENVSFGSKETSQTLYYFQQRVEYEYAGEYLMKKRYFDVMSESEAVLNKLESFQYE